MDQKDIGNTEKSKNKLRLSAINTLLLVAILTYLVLDGFGRTEDDRQAYVVTVELFTQFEYQQELDQEFNVIKSEREKELELMKNDLISLETRIRNGENSEDFLMNYQVKVQQYQNAELYVNQELLAINEDYGSKIWDKLNSFVKEYGELNDYNVIFGASGTGNIMYAEDDLNITEEVVSFCNQKYSGK